jgi:hypothetical protein
MMRKLFWLPLVALLFLTSLTARATDWIWNKGNFIQANAAVAGQTYTAPNTPAASHKILGFIPDFIGVTNKRKYTYNAFPTDSEMPGLVYLSKFGYRVPTPAK